MARVLVVGGSGFVGGHLCRILHAAGWDVIATFHRAPPREYPSGVRWEWLDVREAGEVRALVRAVRCPYVVHLAAQSSAARSFADPAATGAINFWGSVNVLRAASESTGCERFVWVGSAEQYGAVAPSQVPIREQTGFSPCNPYALAKAALDRFIEVSVPPEKLPVVRARLFPCTGPGQADTFVCSDFARQVASALRGGASTVEIRAGNVRVVRDFTDVRDTAAALRALLERGEPGEAYNVCSGVGRTPAEIADQLLALAARPGRVIVDPRKLRPVDAPVLVGCNQKIREATGWQPRVPWEQTLGDLLADWYQRLGALS